MPILLQFKPSIPNYKFRTSILGVEYGFFVRWNTRLGIWAFDVRQANVQIAAGIPILLGAFFGRTSGHTLFQSGVMLARDTSQSHREAGFHDLGVRVQVSYWPRDDMAAEILAGLSPG